MCDDFNINPLHKDIWAERFCDNVTACGLYIVNQCPTRFAPHCKHALIFSNKSFSIHLDQLTLAGISDHDLLFYVCDLDLNSESNHCFSYYDFNANNTDALFADSYFILLIGIVSGISQI